MHEHFLSTLKGLRVFSETALTAYKHDRNIYNCKEEKVFGLKEK